MNKKISLSFFVLIFTAQTLSSFASSPVYVDTLYTQNNAGGHTFGVDAFSTINDAVRAVDVKGIVYVAQGTYHENVLIEKPLSLIGSGKLFALGASNESPVIQGVNGTTTATITVNGVQNQIPVTLRNLTIDGGWGGINILQNAVMTIDRNTIKNYYKNGITFGPVLFPGEGGVQGSIKNNVILGAGPTSVTSQNGIQIAENNTAVVTNNNISNHIYTVPDSWWGTGVLIHRSSNIVIKNNIFTNNQSGINIMQGTNNTVTKNSIRGSTLSKAGVIISSLNDKAHQATANLVDTNSIIGGLVGIWSSATGGNKYINNTIASTTRNGIYSWESDGNIFSGNKIIGVHSDTGDAWGVSLDKEKAVSVAPGNKTLVTNNTVTSSDHGFLTKDTTGVFKNNNINGIFTKAVVDSEGAQTLTENTKKGATGMVLGAHTEALPEENPKKGK